jgi:hypothetical protein
MQNSDVISTAFMAESNRFFIRKATLAGFSMAYHLAWLLLFFWLP